jgi:hypothetical protein
MLLAGVCTVMRVAIITPTRWAIKVLDVSYASKVNVPA